VNREFPHVYIYIYNPLASIAIDWKSSSRTLHIIGPPSDPSIHALCCYICIYCIATHVIFTDCIGIIRFFLISYSAVGSFFPPPSNLFISFNSIKYYFSVPWFLFHIIEFNSRSNNITNWSQINTRNFHFTSQKWQPENQLVFIEISTKSSFRYVCRFIW
jgi:hypothetical protein